MKELANEIVAWLKDYAVKNNRKAFVLGVSGGVDSALVSTLCARTGLPTHCVILPCQSKSNETERGEKHVKWLMDNHLNVRVHKIDLTSTFESFATEVGTKYENQLGFANTKSRLRMIALYQVATIVGGLVAGTGNKVEDYGVGFFTKYGDGGVDIAPIADLTKTEVRQMCRELGVLPELAEAVPTDGLWPDARTDESQLGASYEELEWAMVYNSLPVNDRPEVTSRQFEVLATYDKWHNAGAHKLAPIPTFKRT
jgi:NAD+ synthase